MTDKEAMKLALEALKDERDKYLEYSTEDGAPEYIYEAIRSLEFEVAKQAFEEPMQEPFAWCIESEDSADWCFAKTEEGVKSNSVLMDEDCIKTKPFPLYTTPQPQEFVCSTGLCRFTLKQTNVGIKERGMEAYEAAKKRGWVGVSDERMMEMPKQEPVAAECKFDREKEWGRCSVEHHNLVQSEPHAWPGYETRLLYTTPQPATQDNAFEGLAKAVRKFATEQRAIEAKLKERNHD
jgi:hypothetical protein